jgi:tetratricopeptide (TPR) repeat protein
VRGKLADPATGIALNEPKNFRAIMLSSTFTDLKRHREQVIKAIREFGYKAEVMEESGARAEVDVIDSSLRMVRDSVAYALIIGRKYGQTPICPKRNPDRLSITELEFNEAMRLKRPILLFIMDKKHPIFEEDVELDPDKRRKLDAFRERAKRMRDGDEVQRVYQTFESLEDFSTAATIAIGKLTQQLERHEAADRSSEIATAAEISMQPRTLSNIPINVPMHFLGRDEDLAAVDEALKRNQGRVAITALHGLRGVGKSTLAVAYAHRRREDYQVTWWIRAETESTMRADLASLGVRLDWVAVDAAEELAISVTLAKLGEDGSGVLLIYDNANNSREIQKYLPRGGAARIVVTSTAPDWRGVATQVDIEVWPDVVGANYLIGRSGRAEERNAALALSKALGGLPLAHEQAAAFCQRVGISLGEYLKRFEANPARLPGTEQDAPHDYGRTVAATFALAIEAASKLHPAAEPLIVHAALLAPEPIPLFLFVEAWGHVGFQIGGIWRRLFGFFNRRARRSDLAYRDLDEAIAALRVFALVDRDLIRDERDPTIITDCIRLHRLVRQVAAARREGDALKNAQHTLIEAMEAVYPVGVFDNPKTWPRARRLDSLALALVGGDTALPEGADKFASILLNRLAGYRQGPLAAYTLVRPLLERALRIDEKLFGPNHLRTAASLANLGHALREQGDFSGAQPYCERALSIYEKVFGPDHPDTAGSLRSLGALLSQQGDLSGARSHFERALAISERTLGPEHPETAGSLINLGNLMRAQGNLAGARLHYERALTIDEKALGAEHPTTAIDLQNLGLLLEEQGDLTGARSYFERALAIREKALGLAHPRTQHSVHTTARIFDALGLMEDAKALREKYSIRD